MASSNLGKWSAQASIDASGMQKGAAQAIQSAKGMESALEGIFGRMGAAMKFPGFSLGFESLATGLGLQAVRSAFNIIRDTADEAESFSFLNDNLGTTIEFLSGLRTVAGEAGIGADKFSTAMNRLNQQIGRALQGDQEVLRMFADIGLTAEDLSGPMDTVIQRILAGLDSIQNRSVRARTSTEFFGREGGASMLRLAMNAERFAEAMADVRARGGIITPEEERRIARVDTVFDRMGTRWEQFRRFLTSQAGRVLFNLEEVAGIGPRPTASREALEGAFAMIREGRGNRINFFDAANRPIFPGISEQLQQGVPHAQLVAQLEVLMLAQEDQAEAASAAAVELAAANLEMNHLSLSAERARVRLEELNREAEDAERFTAQARSPLMVFEDTVGRLNELWGRGAIDARTFGRSLEQAFERTGLSGPSPLLGSLSAGGSDTAAILQAAMSPQVDPLVAMEASLEAMREADLERNDFLERLVDWFENGPGAALAGAIEA